MSYQDGQPPIQYADEISLRDIYLLLRKGFGWVVAFAVLCGLVAFLVVSFLPPTYAASSTTLVTPMVTTPSFTLAGGQLSVASGGMVPFEAYETLALSPQALEATVAAVPEYDGGPDGLKRAVTVKKLVGPTGTALAPLSVVHTVRNASPELAKALADAWAQASVELVRASLLDDLTPVSEATSLAAAEAAEALRHSEDAYRRYSSDNDLEHAQDMLSAASAEYTRNEARFRQVGLDQALAEANTEALQEQLAAELKVVAATGTTPGSFMLGMTVAEAAAQARANLDAVRSEYLAATQALREHDIRTDAELLRTRSADLTKLLAERALTLDSIEADLTAARDVLLAQEAELAGQPERLTLTNSVLDDALLLEATRAQPGAAGVADATLATSTEVLNPHHTELLTDVLATRSTIAALEAKQQSLRASIPDLEAERDEIRFALRANEDERELLARASTEARAAYDALVEVNAALETARLRPDADEVLILSGNARVDELRSDMRTAELELVGLNTEAEQLAAAQVGVAELMGELRTEVATTTQQLDELQRDLDEKREAYETVANLAPVFVFLSGLAPDNARVMSAAELPRQPERGRLLPTALAVVLGGFLAVMFIFLRDAVKEQPPLVSRAPDRPKEQQPLVNA